MRTIDVRLLVDSDGEVDAASVVYEMAGLPRYAGAVVLRVTDSVEEAEAEAELLAPDPDTLDVARGVVWGGEVVDADHGGVTDNRVVR